MSLIGPPTAPKSAADPVVVDVRPPAPAGVAVQPPAARPARPPRSRWRRLGRSLIRLHGSPRDIALGAAIGMFVGFLPIVGIQMIVAAVLATLVRASRPAALILVWVTNPLTIPPLYAFTYWVGIHFWPGPEAPVSKTYRLLQDAVARLGAHGPLDLIEQFNEMLRLGASMFMPMTVGGIIVGLAAGTLTYLPVKVAVERYRMVRQRVRERRARRRAERGRAVN